MCMNKKMQCHLGTIWTHIFIEIIIFDGNLSKISPPSCHKYMNFYSNQNIEGLKVIPHSND